MPYTKRRRLVTSAVAVALGATALAACGSPLSDEPQPARVVAPVAVAMAMAARRRCNAYGMDISP